jgi:hypothetical protein
MQEGAPMTHPIRPAEHEGQKRHAEKHDAESEGGLAPNRARCGIGWSHDSGGDW